MDYWLAYVEWAKEPLPETIDYHLWFWFLVGNTLQFIPFVTWMNEEWPNETGKQWRERCLKFDEQDSWWKI